MKEVSDVRGVIVIRPQLLIQIGGYANSVDIVLVQL